MATVEKAVKHRKMWKKSTSRKSAVGRCSVKEMGVFDISRREAEGKHSTKSLVSARAIM